jgi:uncharacterized protein YciI
MTSAGVRISRIFSITIVAVALLVSCFISSSSIHGFRAAQSPEKTSFLVIYRPGPGWLQGKPTSEQPLKEHGRYMMSLFEKGFLKFAGPFGDDKGGAVVLEITSEAEAQALVAGDPAVKSGVFLHEIHPWQLVDWEKYLKKK